MSSTRVLITGVYGLIAGVVYRQLRKQPEHYDVYGLARRRQISKRVREGQAPNVPDDRFFLADIADLSAVRRAVQGMDVVVHLAAKADETAPWEQILHSNVEGTYNVFEASRQAGVGRVVFASSVMASWGYQFDEPYRAIKERRFQDVPDEIPIVTHRDPVRPTEPYSASKVWGEALARVYADVHHLSCICLRIGWVNAQDRPWDPALVPVWSSQRDIVQLVERSINAPQELRFDIFFGVSDNRYRWVDIQHAREVLGYVPQDRGEDHVEPTDPQDGQSSRHNPLDASHQGIGG